MILRKNAKVLIINYKIDTLNGIINKNGNNIDVAHNAVCLLDHSLLKIIKRCFR